MYYAYIRVSTDHQNVENQKHEILTYCQKHNIQIDKWIDETISSRKPLQERKLGKLLKKLKKGDILISSLLIVLTEFPAIKGILNDLVC